MHPVYLQVTAMFLDPTHKHGKFIIIPQVSSSIQKVLWSLSHQVARDNSEDTVLTFFRPKQNQEIPELWETCANTHKSLKRTIFWTGLLRTSSECFWSLSKSFWTKGQANQHLHEENKTLPWNYCICLWKNSSRLNTRNGFQLSTRKEIVIHKQNDLRATQAKWSQNDSRGKTS